MSTGTMTSKGQITIPKDVRDELSLEPGSRVSFVKNEDGFFELHRERRPVRILRGRYGSKVRHEPWRRWTPRSPRRRRSRCGDRTRYQRHRPLPHSG